VADDHGKARDKSTPDMTAFAETLEKVRIETVTAGFMPRDLAISIGPQEPWIIMQGFGAQSDENLQKVKEITIVRRI
jgi:isocitrate dehydrogenase